MPYLDDSWFEAGYQALLESLNFDDAIRKEAIQFLFDEGFWDPEKLSWDAAVKRFRDCCNRNKSDAHWKLPEIWSLMKRFGRHDFALAMMDDLGYEVRQKPTEERRQTLIARALDALEANHTVCQALTAELERLNSGEVFQSSARAGRPRPAFSRDRGGW